jgi:hypothetical protein
MILVSNLLELLRLFCHRLACSIRTLPPGTLGGGLLGLALGLAGWWAIRQQHQVHHRPRGSASTPTSTRSLASSGQQAAGAGPSTPQAQSATKAQTHAGAGAAPNAVPPALQAALAGAKRMTLSMPGVILEEHTAPQLSDSATLRPGVIPLMRHLLAALHGELYLLAHVADDIGQAAVTGALEAGGLVGAAASGGVTAQLRPHRLLFCSTLEGKASIVRQLEPDLHVDAHIATIEQLQRFMPRLALVESVDAGRAGGSGGGCNQTAIGKNVQVAGSLHELLGVQWQQ